MDYDKETGTLECRVCAATYTATINYLSEPVDDGARVDRPVRGRGRGTGKRDAARDRGEDGEEDAPAPKRTRIGFAPTRPRTRPRSTRTTTRRCTRGCEAATRDGR